jgi:hypothetical protein
MSFEKKQHSLDLVNKKQIIQTQFGYYFFSIDKNLEDNGQATCCTSPLGNLIFSHILMLYNWTRSLLILRSNYQFKKKKNRFN